MNKERPLSDNACQLNRDLERRENFLGLNWGTSRSGLPNALLLCAVKREFAVNAFASEAVVIPPRGEKPFPASWTTKSIAPGSSDRKEKHPGYGKHKHRLVTLEKLVCQKDVNSLTSPGTKTPPGQV
jgi:hypothetical protein